MIRTEISTIGIIRYLLDIISKVLIYSVNQE